MGPGGDGGDGGTDPLQGAVRPSPKGRRRCFIPPVLLRGAVMGTAAPRVGAAAPQLPWGGAGGATRSAAVPIALHSAARPRKERSAHAAPRRLPGVPRRCCWEHPLPRGRAPRGHRRTHVAAPSPPLTPHTARSPRAELGVAQPSSPRCPAVSLCSRAAPVDGSGGADVWHCIARSPRRAERAHVHSERFNAEPSALPAQPRRKHLPRVAPRCCREEQLCGRLCLHDFSEKLSVMKVQPCSGAARGALRGELRLQSMRSVLLLQNRRVRRPGGGTDSTPR